jgi:hypothetical protein
MNFANVDDWRSSRALEAEGVACPIGKGRELIVRRAGSRNRAYMAALAEAKTEDIPALERVFAATIVCGWRGLLDEHGREIAYSTQACAELFEQCPDLADRVAKFASDRANYFAAEIEEDTEGLKVIPGGK